jgi:hypothetical protein
LPVASGQCCVGFVAGNTASICRRARALDNTISIAQGGASSLTGADAAVAVLTATASNNLLKAAYTVGFTGHRRGLPVVGTLVLLSGAAGLFGFLFQCPHDRRQGEHSRQRSAPAPRRPRPIASCGLARHTGQGNSQVIGDALREAELTGRIAERLKHQGPAMDEAAAARIKIAMSKRGFLRRIATVKSHARRSKSPQPRQAQGSPETSQNIFRADH